jgi:paraquat-inducible protein B
MKMMSISNKNENSNNKLDNIRFDSNHDVSNLFREESLDTDEENYNSNNNNMKQSSKNLKGFIKDNRNQLNLAKGKVNVLNSNKSSSAQIKLKTNNSDAYLRPSTGKKNTNKNKDNDEMNIIKNRCKELENRCLSLALENKLLRSKSGINKTQIDRTIEDIKRANITHPNNLSLNQSNWQPTMHDISEIALISGLSIDRTRQAFTTIIEDSAEFRQQMADDHDSDITSRIDFLMNELNRILDGVEYPKREMDFNSQGSINFSKISEPK